MYDFNGRLMPKIFNQKKYEFIKRCAPYILNEADDDFINKLIISLVTESSVFADTLLIAAQNMKTISELEEFDELEILQSTKHLLERCLIAAPEKCKKRLNVYYVHTLQHEEFFKERYNFLEIYGSEMYDATKFDPSFACEENWGLIITFLTTDLRSAEKELKTKISKAKAYTDAKELDKLVIRSKIGNLLCRAKERANEKAAEQIEKYYHYNHKKMVEIINEEKQSKVATKVYKPSYKSN